MIHRIKGEIQFECDECRDAFESGTSDFSEAAKKARAAGWQFREKRGEWTHYCGPGCAS